MPPAPPSPGPTPLPTTVPRESPGFRDPEGLAERIAHFMLRKRQFPDLPHEALVIGKYVLLDKVDEGAMGIVCTAFARDLGTVAVKIPKSLGDPQFRARVLREGGLLAQVHHTNVLRVHEVGEWDGTIYIATEYVQGETLRAWQSAPGRGWRAIVRAYLQVGHGLAAIHARQIVHQDIKPDNLRVDAQGVVHVLDFGLAHLETHLLEAGPRAAHETTRTGAAPTFYRGGTPGYMAPEQYRADGKVDARTDQFAFCAALWEALHGALPYRPAEIASTVVGTPRRPLGTPHAGARGPRWLRKLLLRGLSEDPARRFPDMRALLAAIERRLDARRWPVLLAGGAAGLAGALAATLWSAPALPMCAAPAADAAALQAEAREPELAAVAATLTDPTAARNWAAMRDRLAAARRRWSEAHARSCRGAVDTRDVALARVREPCFAARREELEVVVDAMLRFAARHRDDPGAAWDVQRERWEQQLRPADDCLVTGPTLVTPDAAVDAALREARTRLLADDPDAARPLLERARLALDDDRRRRAQVRLELGRVAIALHDHRLAEAQLVAALRDAEASGDDLTAAEADAWLVHVISDSSDHPHAARLIYERAMGRLERLGLEHSARAFDLHLRAAGAARRTGQLAAAAQLLDRAAAVREALGDDALQRAREELQRADLAAESDPEAAIVLIRTELVRLRRTVGPKSTRVAIALRSLGQYQSIIALDVGARTRDAFAAAERSLQESLMIFRRRHGADSFDAATVHAALAKLYQSTRPFHALHHAEASAPLERGEVLHRAWQVQQAVTRGALEQEITRRHDRAADHYRRAIALGDVATPARSERDNLTLARLGLAQAQYQRGRLIDAEAALLPLLARVDDEALGEYGPLVLLTSGEVALAAGSHDLAVERARATLRRVPPRSYLAAEAHWLLARASGRGSHEGRASEARLRELLRDPTVAAQCSFTVADVDRWRRRPSLQAKPR
jgi:tetratricopeptide (TPR) repeat protein